MLTMTSLGSRVRLFWFHKQQTNIAEYVLFAMQAEKNNRFELHGLDAEDVSRPVHHALHKLLFIFNHCSSEQ